MKGKIADQVVAWCVVALGVVPCGFTAKTFRTFDQQAMGFASIGLLQILLGAVNLLRIQYGAVAAGVPTVGGIANVVFLAFVIAISATLPLRSNPQAVVLVALIAATTLFSIVRRPERA